MLLFYIIILLLSLYGISFIKSGFNQDYISKEQCNAIKGIFILFVFTRHIWPYLSKFGYDFSAPGDSLFINIDRWMGQLLVVAFLFYSGFGVMESIKSKGEPYIDNMPRKRILNTLLNFDVAVFVFIVIDLILGINLKLNTTLLAFTGWTSIGNSNWYIFIIINQVKNTIGIRPCFFIVFSSDKSFFDFFDTFIEFFSLKKFVR